MLMDRAWGKAHQTSDVSVTEQRNYVIAPEKCSREEWEQICARQRALGKPLLDEKPKPIDKPKPALN
jgi:hypothetical protein